MSKMTVALLLLGALVLGACGQATTSEGAAAVTTLNASCPIGGDAVVADSATVEFKGHEIGFCCDKCPPKFTKMSDLEKVAALAKNGTKIPE